MSSQVLGEPLSFFPGEKKEKVDVSGLYAVPGAPPGAPSGGESAIERPDQRMFACHFSLHTRVRHCVFTLALADHNAASQAFNR